MRWRLEDLPQALRLRVEAALGAGPAPQSAPRPAPAAPARPAKPAGAVAKLNKTESRFLTDWPPATKGLVLAQALTLPFGDGTSYRPDFLLIADAGVTAYEVKGGHVGKVAWSRHGIERFRRAREKFPAIKFELWQWSKQQWERKL